MSLRYLVKLEILIGHVLLLSFNGKKLHKFFLLQLWLLNSPDLNPIDYIMWGLLVLQEKVYKMRIRDLDELKQRLRTEWAKLDHVVIAAAIRQWRRR